MSSFVTSPVGAVSRGVRSFRWGRIALVGLATTAAAVLANTLVYYVAGAFVTFDSRFPPLANVSGEIVFTLPAAVVATLVYAALLRFARRPTRTFAIIAAIVFVVAAIPDFTYIPTVPGATAAQTATLLLMHVVAAAVIVGMLTQLARPQAR